MIGVVGPVAAPHPVEPAGQMPDRQADPLICNRFTRR